MPQRSPSLTRLWLLAIAFALVLGGLAGPAQAQLRVVSYNIAQLRGDLNALQEVFESLMVDDKAGFAAPVSVFLLQEVRNADLPVLAQLINDAAPPGVLYATGTYTNINRDPVGGAQAMFYRAGMLLEDQTQHADIFTGAGRYADRWRLRLLGYDSPDASFHVYSMHLKASPGSDNQQQRLAGAQAIRGNADALPASTHIIYTGDYNVYNNLEPAYLYFISSGNGQAFDPLGTGPWSGPGNAIKHTQSPRLIQAGGLIGGGMNQRFDLQLITAAFQDGHGLSIIPGTYRSFGNDGMHYNDAINAGNNFYYPDDLARSNALADALHDASDHVPLIVDYQIPARMAAQITTTNLGRVIQGGEIAVPFMVQNTAPNVTTPLGADLLEYTATGSGAISGQTEGVAEAASAPSTGSLPLDASKVGAAFGSITFVSENEAVQNGTLIRNANATVIRPSAPSFSDEIWLTQLADMSAFDADSGAHLIEVDVHNFGYDADQALMNITNIIGLAAPFSYVSGLTQDIGENPATVTISFDSNGLANGLYEADVTVRTSDENLPGATVTDIALSLTVAVGEVAVCEPDFNGDGFVDVSDLLILLSDWGSCDDCASDLNGDGAVDVSDLLILLSAWGVCQ